MAFLPGRAGGCQYKRIDTTDCAHYLALSDATRIAVLLVWPDTGRIGVMAPRNGTAPESGAVRRETGGK